MSSSILPVPGLPTQSVKVPPLYIWSAWFNRDFRGLQRTSMAMRIPRSQMPAEPMIEVLDVSNAILEGMKLRRALGKLPDAFEHVWRHQ